MTKAEAKALLEQHGSIGKAAAAAGMPKSTFRNRLKGVGCGNDDRPAVSHAKAEVRVAGATGGFLLDGKTVLSEKPTDVWKARFYALKRNMGYTVDHLSDEWGSSPDSIRKRAKSIGCLRYVEDSEQPGIYIACVVHPETRKGK